MLRVIDSAIVDDLAEVHLRTFDGISEIAALQEPTFTFAHMILPHYPYLFDRDGRVKRHATRFDQFQSNMWADKQAYVDQLAFVSRRILETIDDILARSEEVPIIVLQSDHGPQVLGVEDRNHVRARMCILNAYLFPDQAYDESYNRITPVNTFRIILNQYFGQELPILDNQMYFSIFRRPYDVQEVTTMVQ